MKLITSLFLLLFHIPFLAQAQNSITVGHTSEIPCLGKLQNIPVTTTGTFNNDNKFTIQLREKGSSTVIATLPAALQSNNIQFTYNDSTFSLYPNIKYRISASSPKTESDWIDTRVHTKGSIQLSAAISDTVNLGEELAIRLVTRSSTEVDVTLNDGSAFELTSYSPLEYTTFHQVKAHTKAPLFIKSATNACGVMLTTGQIKPVANPVSIQTTSTDAARTCEGSEVKISYSAIGNSLPEGSKYRVRFRSVPNAFYQQQPVIAEAPAELKGGVIVTRFPENLKLTTQTNFQVIILATDLGIVGSPGNYLVAVSPKPSVDFYTPDLTIEVGDETRVGVIFKGVPPFTAELSDGSVISASYSGEVYLNKQPDKTTGYSIKSFSSGCGITNLQVPKNMTVHVREGIAIVRESTSQIFCAGSKSRIRIKINGNYNAATTYTVHANYSPSKQYNFPATRNGDYLEFTIPELAPGTDPELSYDGLNNVVVSSNNPAYQSGQSGGYLIQSRPQMVPSVYNTYTYDEPRLLQLTFNIYGKSPFKVEDEKGNIITVQNDWWTPEIYLDKTKDFKIKSISNACFKTENLPSTRVTLTNNAAPGLYLEPFKPVICHSDSLEITFLAPGKFNADNVFHIQTTANCCDFSILKTVSSAGTYKIKIPQDNNDFTYPISIKVVSTNPFFTTETRLVQVDKSLKNFTVYPEGTEFEPALLLPSAEQVIAFRGSGGNIKSLVYSDGISDKSVQFDDPNNLGFPITAPAGKTTKFTLKSVTGSCGTQTEDISTYVKIVPFEIKLSDFTFSNDVFCSGSQISVPFAIENGSRGNATFSLQISKGDEVNYRTIASGETLGIFSTKLPADLAEGYYKMKVISSNGAESKPVTFSAAVLPGATISSPLPQPISVPGNVPVELTLNFTGTNPWTAIFEDNTSQTTTLNPDIRKTMVKEGRAFGLKTVYNLCGYGPVSGSVEVQVKTDLRLFADNYTACTGKNFVVNYELLGDADLSADYIRFELVDPSVSKSILLDSTKIKQGKMELKLPTGLTGDYYTIRCSVRKAGLVTDLDFLLTSPAEVTLSGSSVINSGERTQLVVKSNKLIPGTIQYELSDGTKGDFNVSPYVSFIGVSPARTTTYTISAVSNSCGNGKAYGSATVEVNPASSRSVSITNVSAGSMALCMGDSMVIQYAQTGTFTASNVMTIQISDTTGGNFKSLPTNGKVSPLRAAIPLDVFPDKYYRLRVVASDAGTASSAYQFPLLASQKSTARFASETALYNGADDPLIVVLLEGVGPWRYDLATGNSNNYQSFVTSNAIDSVYLKQASPGQTYKLLNVFNQCGTGIIRNPASITVSIVTGEPISVHSKVSFGPNPTNDQVLLKFGSEAPRNITLTDVRGVTMQTKSVKGQTENVDVKQLPSGTYFIQIDEKGNRQTLKIVKQ